MRIARPMRLTAVLLLGLLLAGILMLVLFATQSALVVWERLGEAPAWVAATWLAVVLLIAGAGLVLAWRLLFGARSRRRRKAEPLTRETLEQRIERDREQGLDVRQALDELHERRERELSRSIHVAFFGQVSTGKSALIRALAPGARAESDARAGTTRAVAHHDWHTRADDRLVLTDAPGLDEAGGLDAAARDEARRAHIVVYVADGDLTASQYRELDTLLALEKPTVVALNKSDRYDEAELAAVRARLEKRLAGRAPVVPVIAGGRETVVRRRDGRDVSETRERPARVAELAEELQRELDRDPEMLARLRDSAVFQLAAEKLDTEERRHRERESERIIQRYARRAVVGALASVTPGSDLVIQGALGTVMLRELAKLHEVSVRDLDLDRFLELAGGRVRKTTAVLLAVAGNACKAFPGLGTVTGGLMHAVAYGMIFESLGHAAARTLATRGELRPLPAAQSFEDSLSEHLPTRARRLARIALEEYREKPRD